MLQDILRNKKAGGLILGGLAAYAYYRYTKMSADEKSKLTQTIKDTAKKYMGNIIPGTGKSQSNGQNAGAAFADAPASAGF